MQNALRHSDSYGCSLLPLSVCHDRRSVDSRCFFLLKLAHYIVVNVHDRLMAKASEVFLSRRRWLVWFRPVKQASLVSMSLRHAMVICNLVETIDP